MMKESKAPTVDPRTGIPDIFEDLIPRALSASFLWSRVLTVAWIVLAIYLFDQLTHLFLNKWLLESLGHVAVFWTNFRMGAWLYVIGMLAYGGAIIVPAYLHPLPGWGRRLALQIGITVGLMGGYWLALNYHDYLFCVGESFGETDPVFGKDLSFYIFSLPALWVTWYALLYLGLCAVASSLCCAFASRVDTVEPPEEMSRFALFFYLIGTRVTMATTVFCWLVGATGIWLSRYSLLIRDNYDSSIYNGAEYIDVVGFFSTLNYLNFSTLVFLGMPINTILVLRYFRRVVERNPLPKGRRELLMTYNQAPMRLMVGGMLLADFAFKGIVTIRDVVAVRPNEPVIQLPYIQRHVDATRKGYLLDQVETVDFVPKDPGDPLPDLATFLDDPAIKNAPLWPGFTSYLERLIDPQHAERVLQTGSSMIYGPSLETVKQQQQLRLYYDFLGVDAVRYRIDGKLKMLMSAVREAPLWEPEPWLHFWGQRFMLFTHGYGLVMAPTAGMTAEGEPEYVSYDIPSKTAWPEITPEENRIYYGEGSATMGFSNVDQMKEVDYPTDQGWAELWLGEDNPAGVRIGSLWKRIILGWRSGRFIDMVFSWLIKEDTRVHLFRTPLERLEQVAPFLYYDTNPYAVVADGRILWMVNALTYSDEYPYSQIQELGDKSDERAYVNTRELEPANYLEDSVKASVDASTGEVTFYQISDKPVIKTWAKIYPGLFTPGSEMPDSIRAQLTYPLHLFHIQFDDINIRYQMAESMYFFSEEDCWDDADEVLGPVLNQGRAITFSMEPYHCILRTGPENGGVLPATRSGEQFCMTMAFTPDGSKNLRGIPVAYQDGEDYGRIFLLRIPKGHFVMGPEQADAAIDQDLTISQRIVWWNQFGSYAIRGHTTFLLVGKEILYVEPMFARSEQNAVPQIKGVSVVFRGRSYMAPTLEEAIRGVFAKIAQEGGVVQQSVRTTGNDQL
ncbi:UPF0182 family protein [Planctomycetota bacterium]